MVKINNTLGSKEEEVENLIAEVDLMRKKDVNELSNKISLLKEQISSLKNLKGIFDEKMREQELRILDHVLKEREEFVKKKEIDHIVEEVNNLRVDVNTLQDLAAGIENVKEELERKSDVIEYKKIREQLQKQGKLIDEVLKAFTNLAKKDELKMNEEMISALENKIDKLKERIKYESRMIEVLLKTFEKQREEFRAILREQDKNIQEQRAIVEARLEKLSEMIDEARKVAAEIKYIRNTLITKKEFVELEERVFEIEEILKKFEIERAEILGS